MDQNTPAGRFAALLHEERELLRDQIAAAWQLHVDTVAESLSRGWRDHIAGALDRRFSELSSRAASQVEQDGRRLIDHLHQVARRLEQSENAASWSSALLDGAALFARRLLLLEAVQDGWRVAGQRGWQEGEAAAILSWNDRGPGPPAFAATAVSLEPLVALATPQELGDLLFQLLSTSGQERMLLLPVLAGRTEGKRRAAALLLALPGAGDQSSAGLETIATIAGTALDCRMAQQRATSSAAAGSLVGIAPSRSLAAVPGAPVTEEELLARAHRFARVKVAEIRLYCPEAVVEGRTKKDLYGTLRDELDRARGAYETEFGGDSAIPDYLHQEVLRTLAHDDETLLGPDYPVHRA